MTGPQLSVPQDATVKQLTVLLNQLLDNEEKLPYSFFIDEQELASSLGEHLQKNKVVMPLLATLHTCFMSFELDDDCNACFDAQICMHITLPLVVLMDNANSSAVSSVACNLQPYRILSSTYGVSAGVS